MMLDAELLMLYRDQNLHQHMFHSQNTYRMLDLLMRGLLDVISGVHDDVVQLKYLLQPQMQFFEFLLLSLFILRCHLHHQ